jgi:hypothetical protein
MERVWRVLVRPAGGQPGEAAGAQGVQGAHGTRSVLLNRRLAREAVHCPHRRWPPKGLSVLLVKKQKRGLDKSDGTIARLRRHAESDQVILRTKALAYLSISSAAWTSGVSDENRTLLDREPPFTEDVLSSGGHMLEIVRNQNYAYAH